MSTCASFLRRGFHTVQNALDTDSIANQRVPRAIHENKHACLFSVDVNFVYTPRDEFRSTAHLDETVLVRPKRPCFTSLACFACTDEIRHDISVTLNVYILSSASSLPYCDVVTPRIHQHQCSDKLAAAFNDGLHVTDMGDGASDGDMA